MSTVGKTITRRARTARPKLDAIGAAAVDLAREALDEVTEPGQVGEHLRVEASADRMVTHVFDCTMPGYRGWSWVVIMSRAPRAKHATVAETALLPGEDALLAPEWEPWAERLRPEDVGADDLLPFREADERLEQGYEATGEEDEDRLAQWELGLGRVRVLSPTGRSEAAERWTEGDFGPRDISKRRRRGTVSAACASCGFLTLLAGSLRGEFGVCTNEWSPADGRVVHLGYGCGAHSETGQEESRNEIPRSQGVVMDELEVEYEKTQTADAKADEAKADEPKPAAAKAGEPKPDEAKADEAPAGEQEPAETESPAAEGKPDAPTPDEDEKAESEAGAVGGDD